eukprot:TRINITY_DN2818_c0_g1_i1.p1 TRINITY_DN2818_c0_g1~~TRINITY_DN2818_c0_g1_i1.p1  ORF type:complete len:346 (+),score=156.72 TRINITY_DN2818_c0_g1_i1:98-1135(+)
MEQHPVVRYSTSELCNKGIVDSLELDKVVLERWDRFMQEGNFRYNTDNIKERVVEGKLGYLAQSQLERARLRRPPQSMMSIKQEFDKDKFNFNKIDESKELVCQLVNTDRESKQVERDILIINVSPIDRGHCLLVPQVEAGLQQVLTVHSITLALEVMTMSTSPHTKLAFNSLCAYASVNHQHWHLYYQPTRLAVQSIPLSPGPGTPYYTFSGEEYPALGWVWLLGDEDMDKMDQVAKEVAKLTMWLTDKEVAHNVVMTRGAGVEGGQGSNHIRVLVWARESVVGAKDPGEFVMAALELTGQILVYEVDKYHTIIEEEVVKAQKEATVSVFAKLKPEVEMLFRSN